jgi:hypothetical protein
VPNVVLRSALLVQSSEANAGNVKKASVEGVTVIHTTQLIRNDLTFGERVRNSLRALAAWHARTTVRRSLKAIERGVGGKTH